MQHHEDKKKNDVRSYRPGRLTILQLMGSLAAVGILAYLILHWLFG